MESIVAFSSDLTMLTVSNKRQKSQWQHTKILYMLNSLTFNNKDITLSHNCFYSLPVGSMNLQHPAEIWCAMKNVFVRHDASV